MAWRSNCTRRHVVGEVLQPDPRLGPHQYAEGIDTPVLKDAKAFLDGLK
jgi:hypothetical protein